MGNRMTVAKPYIIDEYSTDDDDKTDDYDDDDDDDDYFSYETAYDTEGAADHNLDEEDSARGWTPVKAEIRGDNTTNTATTGGGGQQVTVNSQVVSSLVKEVETLLSFLDREDYEGAQKAARMLKEGGGSGGGGGGGECEGKHVGKLDREESLDESKPLLANTESATIECFRYTTRQQQQQDHGTTSSSSNGFGDDEDKDGRAATEAAKQPLLSSSHRVDADDADNASWTTAAQREALQKLDRDLTSFEENESRMESSAAATPTSTSEGPAEAKDKANVTPTSTAEATAEGEATQPRRRRKSSLPRLKRNALLGSGNCSGANSDSGAGGGASNGVGLVSSGGVSGSGVGMMRNQSRSRSRESRPLHSNNRSPASSSSGRAPRSPASCIPRFCYKVTATKSSTTTSAASTGVSPAASVAMAGGTTPATPATPATTATTQRKGASLSSCVPCGGGSGKKPVDEAITSVVKGFTSQTEPFPDANDSFRGNPVSYTNHSCDDDDEGEKGEAGGHFGGNEAGGPNQSEAQHKLEAWEVNISDISGRAKRNKKRSGIPSLWTQTKSHHPPSSSTSSFPSPSSSSASSSNITSADSLNLFPSTATAIHAPILPRMVVNSGTQTVDNLMLDCQSQTSSNSDNNMIPRRDAINKRKIFDLRRWNCISRPQYKSSCGISAVVSCWNFLFSTLGHGHLHPLTQEEALDIIGYEPPYDNIKFGPTTGNLKLMKWFRLINSHFKVQGRCYFMYKPQGRNRTAGVTSQIALDKLKTGLRDKNTTFVYHCHNHYFCPVGFEESPLYQTDAYNEKIAEESLENAWILIGDTSKKYGPFHCKKWEDICLDLNCKSPEYFNIRQSWNGVMKRAKTKRVGSNLHCIMCFQKPMMKMSSMSLSSAAGVAHAQPWPMAMPSTTTSMMTTVDDQNQHNKSTSGIRLQEPFVLHSTPPSFPHPPPPPPTSCSINSSSSQDTTQDEDGGGGGGGSSNSNVSTSTDYWNTNNKDAEGRDLMMTTMMTTTSGADGDGGVFASYGDGVWVGGAGGGGGGGGYEGMEGEGEEEMDEYEDDEEDIESYSSSEDLDDDNDDNDDNDNDGSACSNFDADSLT